MLKKKCTNNNNNNCFEKKKNTAAVNKSGSPHQDTGQQAGQATHRTQAVAFLFACNNVY